ncbi:MAG: hypothetical protein CME62_08650 [Halobacteriovoraceae bacterium]|nr:hypothetical protein [Halobacteriovoraceae bacterium]|tara:strand:+ start:22062 stop:23348 length:1287 start_codon:yes stop_codon:yes gene_type:complete
MIKTIKFLIFFKVGVAVCAIFSPFTHPHIIRQTDTMGVALRFWLRWTTEAELMWPLLPAVLTAGDNYGIAPMEFPFLNLITAPFFAFGLEWGRILASLFVVVASLLLVWWHSRVWRGVTLFDVDVSKASWLLLIFGVSQMYWHRFMPDFWSFILVSLAMGLSWNKTRVLPSFLLASLGMLLKPPAIIALGFFLIKDKKTLIQNILKWILPATCVCLVYYIWGIRFLEQISDMPGYFKVGFRNPIDSVIGFFSQPKEIGEIFFKSIFTSYLFIFIAGYIAYKWILKKQVPSFSLWGILFLQIFAVAILDGDHAFIHDYYFVGTSLTASVIFMRFLQKAPQKLVVLSLVILCFYHIERGIYGVRPVFQDNIWKQCSLILEQNLLAGVSKIDTQHSPYPTLGLCFGKVQNAKSSPFYIFIEDGKVKGKKKN